jgi:hypothetical protein
MRGLASYTAIWIISTVSAFIGGGSNESMGTWIAGFTAIFICQPWLAIGWFLEGAGLVHLPPLSGFWIALFGAINIGIWYAYLRFKQRHT